MVLLDENNSMKQKIYQLEEQYQQDKQSSSFDESFEQWLNY